MLKKDNAWVDPNKNQTDYIDSSTIDPCTQHVHIVVGGGYVEKDRLKEFSAEGNKRKQ